MFGAGGRGLRKPARSRLTPALDVGGRPADCGTLADGSEQAGRRKDGSQLGLQGALGDQRHPGERAGVSRPRSLSRWAPPTAALCLVQPPIPKPLPCGARPAAAGSPTGSPRGRQEDGRETASGVPSRCAPCTAGREGSPSTLSGSLAENPTAVREVPGAQVHTHARFLLCVFSRREEGPPAGSPSPSAARFNRGRSPGEGGARGTTFGAPAACRTHDLLPGGGRDGRGQGGLPAAAANPVSSSVSTRRGRPPGSTLSFCLKDL